MSHRLAFYSATLLLGGGYLLFVSAIGYYVRFFGGSWGRALQLAVLFGALLALAVLALSSTARARLRVFVSKNFFAYRFDYREEWLRFTTTLSSSVTPQEMGVLVIRVLALGALTGDPGLLGFLKTDPPVLSLGSGFAEDARRAEKLRWMEGKARTLPQAAIRFALMKGGVSSVLVGFSGADQLEEAVSCSGAAGLTRDELRKLQGVWDSDFT